MLVTGRNHLQVSTEPRKFWWITEITFVHGSVFAEAGVRSVAVYDQ